MKTHYILIIFVVTFLLVSAITALIQTHLQTKKKKKNDRVQTRYVRPRNNGKQK